MLTFEETCIAAATLQEQIGRMRAAAIKAKAADKRVVEVFLSILTWGVMRRLDGGPSLPKEVGKIWVVVENAVLDEMNNLPNAEEILASLMVNYPVEGMK